MTTGGGHTAAWIDRMRETRVPVVAETLGIEAQSPRSSSSKGSFPCPACNAERRHTQTRDKRGAAGMRADGLGWHCFQCEAHGDTLDLVAYSRCGDRYPALSDSGKAEVRTWCMRWLGLDSSSRRPSSPAPRRAPPRPPPAAPPPRYPPLEEIEALWNDCARADELPEVEQWLRSKRIDAQTVADRDLARALRPDAIARLPKWVWCRAADGSLTNWARAGYLLIVSMVDAHGAVRSVLARNVRGAEPKSRPTTGFERRGLVLGCGLTRQVLTTGQRPEWWPTDLPLRFEIAEGEKKWCMRVAERRDADAHAPAVIGIESGSWTDELAARIPDGSSVFVATDRNNQGALYATAILRSLQSRVRSRTIRVELQREHAIHDTKDGPAVTMRTQTP